jgi:dTMP kinase
MFIVMDGIDGCGKSTQVKLLAELLRKRGRPVVTSKWKDSTYVERLFIGDLLKRFQDGTVRIPPEARTFLLGADISNRLESCIKPALAKGHTVIGDRYVYKVVAQGLARGLKKPWLDNLFAFALAPEIKVFLDLDPAQAAGRILSYRDISYYEAGMDVLSSNDRRQSFIDFQSRVRRNLLAIADEVGGLVLDAGRPPEIQHQEIARCVEPYLGGTDQ